MARLARGGRDLVIRCVALALAVLTAPAQAQTHGAAPQPVFRFIIIGPSGRIELGRPFSQKGAVGKPVGPHLYRLVNPGGKPGSYGGTEAILVDLTLDSLVHALHFIYPPGDEAFRSRVAAYTAQLGPPTMQVLDSVGVHVRQARWQDSLTIFDLIETTSAGEVRQRAVLTDRRLKIDGR